MNIDTMTIPELRAFSTALLRAMNRIEHHKERIHARGYGVRARRLAIIWRDLECVRSICGNALRGQRSRLQGHIGAAMRSEGYVEVDARRLRETNRRLVAALGLS